MLSIPFDELSCFFVFPSYVKDDLTQGGFDYVRTSGLLNIQIICFAHVLCKSVFTDICFLVFPSYVKDDLTQGGLDYVRTSGL